MNLSGNIFDNIPADASAEQFFELASIPGVRIERIVSFGQTTPDNLWLDQAWSEWVLVLRGSARILFENEADARPLLPGDWLEIRPHVRHRVEHTDIRTPTVWLAIHAGSGVDASAN